MSYHKFISESPSATTGVAFLPDTYTQQSMAGSIAIPIFITTEADIPKGFTAVPEKRVSDIIEELNTYACGQKQLKELNTLCDDKGFEIQFVYPDEQKNENEYALKLNESISSFVSSDDSTKKIIYICVNKEPPPSVERNVCIYDKSTGIIEKTKTYIIQDNPIKSDAYRVGHELSHATVFISFLSDIKSCFEQYVELMGTSQSNMFQIQIKDTSELKNEHQKQFLQDILSNCAGRCFPSLKNVF